MKPNHWTTTQAGIEDGNTFTLSQRLTQSTVTLLHIATQRVNIQLFSSQG